MCFRDSGLSAVHKEWLVCAQKQVFSLVPCDDEGKEPEVSLAEFLLLVHIWYRFVLFAAEATAPVTAQGKSAINFDTYSTQRPEKNLTRGGGEGGKTLVAHKILHLLLRLLR